MLFKINGERNSGTMFLTDLLEKNFGSEKVYVQELKDGICYHWKHGVPDNCVKKLNERVVDVFIFRELSSWLVSMYYNIYHLAPYKCGFVKFLIDPQKSNECLLKDYRTGRWLNEDDNDKTIFEIRYYKFLKIMEYAEKNPDVILVSLQYLQNEDNCLKFLNALNQTYQLGNQCFYPKMYYSKNHTIYIKNRSYPINIDDYKEIIERFQNKEIETFINQLEFQIR